MRSTLSSRLGLSHVSGLVLSIRLRLTKEFKQRIKLLVYVMDQAVFEIPLRIIRHTQTLHQPEASGGHILEIGSPTKVAEPTRSF